MPTTYQQAPPEIVELVTEVAESFHPELCTEGVKYDLLMAYGPVDENTGCKTDDALKKNGIAAAAIVRVIGLRDRAKGCGDTEIAFDGDRWIDYSDAERRALIDHELTHLRLSRNKADEAKRDDLGRPKLKLRPHDFEIGGFASVIHRHGRQALELQSLRKVGEGLRQLELRFDDDSSPDEEFRREIAETFASIGIHAEAMT